MTRMHELEWHTMPRDQGQIVEVSYAADEYGLWRRTHNRSDRTTVYEFAEYEEVNEYDFQPWNGRLPSVGEWESATLEE